MLKWLFLFNKNGLRSA